MSGEESRPNRLQFGSAWTWGAVVMLAIAWASSGAAADDAAASKAGRLEARCDALSDVVATHLKKREYGSLDSDITEIKALYKAVTTAEKDELEDDLRDDLKEMLVDLVRSMARGRHAKHTAVFVLRSLGELGDPNGAKTIRHYLRQPNPKESSPELQAAVAAAAHVPDDSLVEPLLKIVDRSKTFRIAADAIKSLGHFKTCTRKREKILEELVKSVKKNKPGGRPGMRGGGTSGMDPNGGYGSTSAPMGQEGSPAARWSTLSPVLAKAMNQLTGQKLTSAEDWFIAVHDAKGHLDSLFTND